ncbi:MAG TPA: long-chain fatty acid--CoA ligase [Gammaproteobacteria bacterium]|nr:long-chain fatty acid--CoA ligase [Gammaproteobacteria bacterium]
MQPGNQDYINKNDAKNLHQLFQIRAERTPHNIAYRYYDNQSDAWHEYTWTESLAQINRWRQALQGEGLKQGQSVGIMLKNCPEWIFLEQACMAQGIISVPLYPNDRPDNIAHIVNESDIALMLIEDQLQWTSIDAAKDRLHHKPIIISLKNLNETSNDFQQKHYQDWLQEHDKQDLDDSYLHFDPQALATIVYTSGTTGRPKGVMLSHWNILSNAASGIQAITIFKDDLFLSFLPLSHTLERTVGYYIPVMTGASVAFSRSIPQLAEDLLIIKPTILISVPRIFERVYSKIQVQLEAKSPIAHKLFQLTESIGWERFEYQQGRGAKSWRFVLWPLLNKLVAQKLMDKLGGRLRFAISGGAPLPETIAHLFISFGLPILQGYGLTETSPVISVNTLEDNIPSSIGLPLPGVEVRIGENSELLTRSESVMSGYWKNTQATREIFTDDGWLKTGDLAKIENKHIYITGRLKEILVLSNGEKIPPVDMEIAICLNPLFEQALVVGEGKSFLTAIAVLNPEQWKQIAVELSLDPDSPESIRCDKAKTRVLAILCRCLKDFPGYAQIRQITLSLEPWTDANHLLTPSLKIRRKILLEHFSNDIDSMYAGH